MWGEDRRCCNRPVKPTDTVVSSRKGRSNVGYFPTAEMVDVQVSTVANNQSIDRIDSCLIVARDVGSRYLNEES
jgi:hypothetical protein